MTGTICHQASEPKQVDSRVCPESRKAEVGREVWSGQQGEERQSRCRRSVLALLSFTLLSTTTCQREPPVEEFQHYTIEQFLATTAMSGGGDFSPDSSTVLIGSQQTGVFNAFAVPVDGEGPVQLTHSTDEAIWVKSFFPGDERFLYAREAGGAGLYHLFVRELDGTSTDLTPGEGHTVQFLSWTHDGRGFLVATNERNPRYFDVYLIDADKYRRELMYKNEAGFDFFTVHWRSLKILSPDRRFLVLEKTDQLFTGSDIYIYDREESKLTHLTPHEGQVSHVAHTFGADSSSLYYSTDEDGEFNYLVRRDLQTGETSVVFKPEGSVVRAFFSNDWKYLVVGTLTGVRAEAKLYEAATMTELEGPSFPNGVVFPYAFSPDGRLMSFYLYSDRSPFDLYVYDFSVGESKQLTRNLNPELNPDHLVAAQVVRFNSLDGLEIEGILYKPLQASPQNKAPALVWVHGGLPGLVQILYSGPIQYLVNHGYVVFAPNYRGSLGYGKTFVGLDDRKHGQADLDDCVASKNFLIDTGYVDPEKIGIIGASYGGYLVLAALAFRPREFDVGVDFYGISDWMRSFESEPAYWEAGRKGMIAEVGDPVADREFLESTSPLRHAENIVRPLMVLHGAKDQNVLRVESDSIVEAVKANGVPVEYLVFEDEGHGFYRKENQAKAFRAVLDFLDRYLKKRR